jgi:hypothetical protein
MHRSTWFGVWTEICKLSALVYCGLVASYYAPAWLIQAFAQTSLMRIFAIILVLPSSVYWLALYRRVKRKSPRPFYTASLLFLALFAKPWPVLAGVMLLVATLTTVATGMPLADAIFAGEATAIIVPALLPTKRADLPLLEQKLVQKARS